MKRRAPTAHLRIEKGIPIPTAASQIGYTALLRSLKVGESILFPESDKSTTVRKRAAQALGSGNYAVRKVAGGTRVWRIR